MNFRESMDTLEKNLLKVLMEENRYNQSAVAKITGLSRHTLRSKLYKYFGNQFVGGNTFYKYKEKK